MSVAQPELNIIGWYQQKILTKTVKKIEVLPGFGFFVRRSTTIQLLASRYHFNPHKNVLRISQPGVKTGLAPPLVPMGRAFYL